MQVIFDVWGTSAVIYLSYNKPDLQGKVLQRSKIHLFLKIVVTILLLAFHNSTTVLNKFVVKLFLNIIGAPSALDWATADRTKFQFVKYPISRI